MARHPCAPTATMIITRMLARPTDTTARIGLSAESLSASARGSTDTGGEASTAADSMDVVSGGLGLVAAALPDEAVSRAAGSPDADQLAADSVAALARSAVVQAAEATVAADFMEAVDFTVAAEATAAGIAKTSRTEIRSTNPTADGICRRPFPFSIS